MLFPPPCRSLSSIAHSRRLRNLENATKKPGIFCDAARRSFLVMVHVTPTSPVSAMGKNHLRPHIFRNTCVLTCGLYFIILKGDNRTRFNQGCAPSSRRARRSTAPHLIGSSPLSYFRQTKSPSGWMGILFGGHILVKFELKTDSISWRVRVWLPSL